VAAALSSPAHPAAAEEPAKREEESRQPKATKFSSSEAEARPKFPHQHRSGIATPSDHQLPLLSNHPNPYYAHQAPMSRHASFNFPYAAQPPYPNPDHYQNENYYEMRKIKSSSDLQAHDDYRYHSSSGKEAGKRARDERSLPRDKDRYASKVSSQTNGAEVSRSRSRSPWRKEKAAGRGKRASRSRSRSPVDSVDSERSKSSGRHKKAKKRHGSGGRRQEGRREDRPERESREERERSDSRHKHRHHKSAKSSKSRRSKEREGEATRYVPIYS